MSERKRSNWSGTAGSLNHRPKCFGDILDVVLHLTDEEWKAVSRDMPREVTRLEFAAACTKIVASVSSAVVRRLLKPISRSFGIDAIVEANDRLKSMESKSETSDDSADSSPTEASEFICHLGQRIVTEIKGAMLEAIRRTASEATPPSAQHLDDLSVACTNEICDKILALYHSEELKRPGEEKSSETSIKSQLEVHGIMKSLEQVVSISKSSSRCTVSSAPDITMTEVLAPDCAASAVHAERPFSDQFMSKASQMISEVLLKTEQKLSTSLSPQTSIPVMTELAESTASEILQKLFLILVQSLREHLSGVGRSEADRSGPVQEETFLSEAQKIHTGIHKQVFKFFRKRQQAVSEKSQTLLDVFPEVFSELNIGAENIQKPEATERFLNQATRDASDILVKRLNSHISTGSVSVKDSSSGATPPSKASVDLDQAVSDNISKLLSEEAPEIREIDTEKGSEGLSDKRKFSVQSSSFAPLHLFSVVRNQMKSFVSKTFSKRFADDDNDDDVDDERSVCSVQEIMERRLGCSFSDSALDRGNRTLHSIQFPSELIKTFVQESTKGLLQNVLNTSASDENSSHTAEDQEEKTSRTRFIVKTDRRLVVKNSNVPKKQKTQSGVPPLQGDEANICNSAHLHSASHRESNASHSVFRNARRTLGWMFNNSQTLSEPLSETEP